MDGDDQAVSETCTDIPIESDTAILGRSGAVDTPVEGPRSSQSARDVEPQQTAQEVMWACLLREQAQGRVPAGAELHRVAGTNNYGRTVLRHWREQGRIPPPTNPTACLCLCT